VDPKSAIAVINEAELPEFIHEKIRAPDCNCDVTISTRPGRGVSPLLGATLEQVKDGPELVSATEAMT